MTTDVDWRARAKEFLRAELTWPNLRSTLVVLAITLVPFAIGAEILLRASCTYCSWKEKNKGEYASPYQEPDHGWYHVRPPNQNTSFNLPEFDYELSTNSLGIRDIEHPVEKLDNEFRIMGIGDSFTEGDGAPYEASYLKMLERNLDANPGELDFTAIVGGVAGSDPFYGYYLLRDKLLVFDPDLVTVAINNSDISDIMVRGGEERFLSDGSIRYAEPAGDEWLFRRSHLYRFIKIALLDYDWLQLSRAEHKRRKTEAIVKIAAVLEEFQSLADREGFELVAIIHPMYNEYQENEYDFEVEILKSHLGNAEILFFDLLAYFDGTGALENEPAHTLYWERDLHHNAEGYERFAEGLEAYLREQDVIPQGPSD